MTTDKAFLIGEGGRVNIESYSGSVSLNADKVQNGGNMNIQAGEIVLGAGFEVEKGGTLIINGK